MACYLMTDWWMEFLEREMLQLTVLNGGVLSEKFNQDCQTLPPPTMAIFSETVPKKHVQGFVFLSKTY